MIVAALVFVVSVVAYRLGVEHGRLMEWLDSQHPESR